MFRTFILPVILMGVVGIPMLYSHHQRHGARSAGLNGNLGAPVAPDAGSAPWRSASFQQPATVFNQALPNSAAAQPGSYAPTGFPQAGLSQAGFPQAGYSQTPSLVTQSVAVAQAQPSVVPQSLPALPTTTGTVATQPVSTVHGMPGFSSDMAWAQPGMTPDFAKTETLVFHGDANGPDLSAQAMSFTPTIDLSSLFRFDISKQSVTSRWDRVSTIQANDGLHGMRVALVTGTNSWDLHGSLTYWFDVNHRVQRITYRGWTGDASRLLQILASQHQLKPQPTHWAGAYLSKRSGLLMKYPTVIDKSNSVQQLALILELNNPRGNSAFSDDFRGLLPAAIESR